MTETSLGDNQLPHSDDEARRAAAFGAALNPEDYAAALRAGRAPVSKKVILITTLALALAIAVSTTLEKLFGNFGQPSRPVTTHLVAPANIAPSLSTLKHGQRGSSLADILGLRSIENVSASNLTLTDQHARPWSLGTYRGHVVVVTFFDVACQDICPVLGAEIRAAATRLDAQHVNATFVIVNTNPYQNAIQADPPALADTNLSKLSNVYFLNGPEKKLNSIWSSYGVQIRVAQSGRLAHNDVLYFISPRGQLAALAIPFGNENHSGNYSLPSSVINRFAQGIAQVVTSLSHA